MGAQRRELCEGEDLEEALWVKMGARRPRQEGGR